MKTAPPPPATLPLSLRQPRRGWKRLLPQTLFGRALLIIATPALITQLVATWIFYDRHWETLTYRLASGVAGDIAFVIGQLVRDPSPLEQHATLRLARERLDLQLSFTPSAHLPATPQRDGLLDAILTRALNERVGFPFTIDTRAASDDYDLRIQLPGGVMAVRVPERRLFSPTSYIFILWMTGSFTILFSIALIFLHNQIRPIRRLAVAAERFGMGREVPHFRPEGAAEVRQAATAFLGMRERIHRQIRQRTEMLAGVSHDLRTPLTRMKLQLALMGDNPEVEELKADVVEMEAMIEGYLAFARGEGNEAVQPTDLQRLLNEVVGAFQRQGGVVELTLPAAAAPGNPGATGIPALIPLRPVAMRRCLSNLLANIHRYAHGRAWIGVRSCGGSLEIHIDDDGPGIPAAAREEVFRPFHRLEGSRHRARSGSGLGLTIARDIVRGHGGEITLADSPHGGLRVTLRLPL
mgnify:CR=1 FL=1